MLMRKFSNFITSEFFSIFNPVFFGLLFLSMALRFAKIYETSGFNLSFSITIYIIILLLPAVSLVIIPIAFLVAVSITTTKLSSTSEITAFQSSGISAAKVAKTLFYIAIFIFSFNLIITLFVKPFSSFELKKTLAKASSGKFKITLQEKIFNKMLNEYYIYCDKSDSYMENVIFFNPSKNNDITIITANKSKINYVGSDIIFNFLDGNFVKLEMGKTTFMDFKQMNINPFADDAQKTLDIGRGGIPTSVLFNKILENKANALEKTELSYRFFTPLSILLFLLLAFPFSLSHSRNYKTSGITISIFVGLIYYILFSFVNTFSIKGLISPMVGFLTIYLFLFIIGWIIFYIKVWKKA